MTGKAVAVAAALGLLAALGMAETAGWMALGLLVTGVVLDTAYRRARHLGKRGGRPCPDHRRQLDRWVRSQWIGAGLFGVVLAQLGSATDIAALASAGRLAEALAVAAFAASAGLFISGLVDWYVILPRVSGIAGPAPCETAGPELWRYVTGIWYFHRAAAIAIAYAAAVGVPAYMGATASSLAAGAAWLSVAVAIAVGAGYLLRETFRTGWRAFDPTVYVGHQVYAEDGNEDELYELRKRAYITDLSLHGAKCKLLHDCRYTGPKFASKHDLIFANEELPLRKVTVPHPLCPYSRCSGVNWYCRHNPAAHD